MLWHGDYLATQQGHNLSVRTVGISGRMEIVIKYKITTTCRFRDKLFVVSSRPLAIGRSFFAHLSPSHKGQAI